jgi:hypothetical protein
MDHGDIDFVCKGDPIKREQIFEIFGPVDVSRNGKTVSILYKGVQIDLSFHMNEDFDSAFDFYRLGDVGQIAGRLAHSLGFKYGHRGLIYPVKLSDSEELGEVVINRSTEKIMKFLDLDYEQWKIGFNDSEEMFHWMMKSKYFNPEIFKFENLNNINKVRNKKRPMYAALVKFLEEYCIKDEEEESWFEPTKNKTEYLWNALIHFGNIGVLKQISELIEYAANSKTANSIFNGNDIMELAFIEGKELGKVYSAFKQHCIDHAPLWMKLGDDIDIWVLHRFTSTKEDMHSQFMSWYKNIYLK